MEKKFFKEILQPYLTQDTVIMLVMSLALLKQNPFWGIAGLIITALINVIHVSLSSKKSIVQLQELKQEFLSANEEITKAFVDSSPVFMCVTNAAGEISWTSQGFRDEITKEQSLEGILSKEELEKLFGNEHHHSFVEFKNKRYSVSPSAEDDFGHSKRMLFWNDVTAMGIIKERFKSDMPCIAVVSIDNYDEIMASATVDEQAVIAADIDKLIRESIQKLDGALVKTRGSSFFAVLTNKDLQKLKEESFPMMEQAHLIKTKADFPVSLSVGIGSGAANYSDLHDMAVQARDLALGRGGDQIVIKYFSGETEYFGGNLGSVEKRNKGRSRIMAHALSQLMNSSDRILIMGHARPDMDAFGAAIGIAAFAPAESKVFIVMPGDSDAIDLIYNAAKETGKYIFADAKLAMELITENSLLVVVDTQIPAICEAPELLSKASKLVVIDHHRKSSTAITNPLLSYTEPYASSTSELVTEMLQYKERHEYTKFEMNALLAGISMDTKNFSVNVGVRTFEAAAWLKRNGALNADVNSFFRMRLSFYQKKVNMIASAQLLGNSMAVAYTNEQDHSMQVLVAQTADELLEMREIETVFVAGRGDKATMISARSNGKINVQVLMEKMGGGGHMNVAAAQSQLSPELAIASVVKLLREEKLID